MKNSLTLAVALLLTAVAPAWAADVKENWEKNCTKCHGADGKGDTKMGKKAGVKDYTDPKVQAELKTDQAFKRLKDGLKEGDKTKMKPYAGVLTDEEIKALIDYMRTFKK